MRSDAEPWWQQAEADFIAAGQLMAAGSYFGVSWFAQQSVEKALKALHLDIKDQEPPRTHDLERLARLLDIPAKMEADIAVVNPAFDLARYPNPVTGQAPVATITVLAAETQLAAAERTLRWVKQQLLP